MPRSTWKRSGVLTALVSAVLVSGACSDPRAASESNFGAALQAYYASGRPACLDVAAGFPHDIMEGAGEPLHNLELFGELVSIGLLASEPVQKEVPKNQFSFVMPGRQREMRTISGTRYSITEMGTSVGQGRPASRMRTSFCYGTYQYREVKSFTEPTAALGQTASRVSYTFEAVNIVDWVKSSEILQAKFPRLVRDLKSSDEPIEEQAVLVLTGDGWVHSAMFGK